MENVVTSAPVSKNRGNLLETYGTLWRVYGGKIKFTQLQAEISLAHLSWGPHLSWEWHIWPEDNQSMAAKQMSFF